MIGFDTYGLPLDTIRALLFEQELVIGHCQEILSSVRKFRHPICRLPKEGVYLLCTVMFLEAPERVIARHLNKVPKDYMLEGGW